jgi:CubicO group peptidase (beta-lactamase class C family)
MQTLWQDLRYGARTLLNKTGFTLIAVITLVLGIGLNTVGCSAVALFRLPAEVSAQELTPKFDEYFNALIRQNGFSGAVLAARDGKVVYAKGAGFANVELAMPNTPQTKFRVGSITKQFTAAAILLLQERGKLSVHNPVCKFFSDCPRAWKEITLHHLLAHTSGLPNYTDFPDYDAKMALPETNESLIARFKNLPLEFKPGRIHEYSNSGYILLGAIIENVSGESYENFLRRNIFAPLEMNDTGVDRNEVALPNRAAGYSLKDGKLVNAAYQEMSQAGGAGVLYSTVEDLFRWNEGLFGGKVLQPKSLEAMTTTWAKDYGYGLVIQTDFHRKHFSHGGRISGFYNDIEYFPDDRVTVVVLRNLYDSDPPPRNVAFDLAAIVLSEKYEVPRSHVEVKVDRKILDTYIGRYELEPNVFLTIARSATGLTVQQTGQRVVDLFAESETQFFTKFVEMQFRFMRDDKGLVTGVMKKRGEERFAKKVK